MSPFSRLIANILTLVAVLLVFRKLAPYLERLSADYGVERLYRQCSAAVPYLIVVGILWTVMGFVLTLVLGGIAE